MDILRIAGMVSDNAIRVCELLTMPRNGWIPTADAAARRANAAQLAECNRFLMSLLNS